MSDRCGSNLNNRSHGLSLDILTRMICRYVGLFILRINLMFKLNFVHSIYNCSPMKVSSTSHTYTHSESSLFLFDQMGELWPITDDLCGDCTWIFSRNGIQYGPCEDRYLNYYIVLSAIEKILVKLMSIGHQRPQPQYNSAWAMVTLLQTNVMFDPIVISQVNHFFYLGRAFNGFHLGTEFLLLVTSSTSSSLSL